MKGAPEPASALRRPLIRAGVLVGLVFLTGTVGYTIIGHPEHGVGDALYMTVITLTTVGFGEVIDLSHSPGGRAFTIVLLLGGVGSFLSFFSAVTAFFVEGSIQHLLWQKRMKRRIDGIAGHTVVCGGGNTGIHIARELMATERPFVLIEGDEERAAQLAETLGEEVALVLGDATEDRNLIAAGIERASALVACISSDKDNLIVTLSARLLNPELRIVCRCIEEGTEKKIRKAGADAVVSVNRIGGLRLVSEAVRPTAVSYLDQMLRGTEETVRVESTEVAEGAEIAGRTVGDLRTSSHDRLLLLALHLPDGKWQYAPDDQVVLEPGVRLVYVGGPDVRTAVERIAAP